MTLLAFKAADFLYRHFRAFARFDLFVVGLEALVVFIIHELHLGLAVAVDAPAHAQRRVLVQFLHGLHRPVAGLALQFSDRNVLGVIEIYVVRQVVDTDPFDRAVDAVVVHFLIGKGVNDALPLVIGYCFGIAGPFLAL